MMASKTSTPAVQESLHQQTCPKCGYCPHCGRGGQQFVPYPVYPWGMWPRWPSYPSVTVSGGVSNVSSSLPLTTAGGSYA